MHKKYCIQIESLKVLQANISETERDIKCLFFTFDIKAIKKITLI